MKKERKIIMICTLAAVLSGFTLVSLAEETESRRFSVIQTEGEEAYITRGAGKKLKAVNGMNLSQGNTASTGALSEIYMEADEDKVWKLGEHTSVEVTKVSAKSLKLTLKQGKLFFNIENPLEADEEVTFQAAHSSMSIRGTSGIFWLTPEKLIFYLIDGNVTWDLGTGETIDMTAGQVIELLRDWDGNAPGPGVNALYKLVRLESFSWEELDDSGLAAVMEQKENLDSAWIGLDTEEELAEARERVQRYLETVQVLRQERFSRDSYDDNDYDDNYEAMIDEEDAEEDDLEDSGEESPVSTPSDAEEETKATEAETEEPLEKIQGETGDYFYVLGEDGDFYPEYWVYYEEGVNGDWYEESGEAYWDWDETFITEMEEQGYYLG